MKQEIFYLECFSSNGIPLPSSKKELKEKLDDGFIIKSTTAQVISKGTASSLYGGFLLVLEKDRN